MRLHKRYFVAGQTCAHKTLLHQRITYLLASHRAQIRQIIRQQGRGHPVRSVEECAELFERRARAQLPHTDRDHALRRPEHSGPQFGEAIPRRDPL